MARWPNSIAMSWWVCGGRSNICSKLEARFSPSPGWHDIWHRFSYCNTHRRWRLKALLVIVLKLVWLSSLFFLENIVSPRKVESDSDIPQVISLKPLSSSCISVPGTICSVWSYYFEDRNGGICHVVLRKQRNDGCDGDNPVRPRSISNVTAISCLNDEARYIHSGWCALTLGL